MKSILKIALWLFLMFVFAWSILNLNWLAYGFRQASGQWRIAMNARSVADIRASPDTPDTLRQRLDFVDSVKEYAWGELGLVRSDIYRKLYDQKGDPAMFVVVAAEPFALEDFEWEIPLVGKFPYLGFFDARLAIGELNRVRDLGYDARIRTTDGWSTLGFLENPLLSNNLADSRGDLANLILHEIAHETVYVFNQSELNENLASFIGDQGTLQLLRQFYGDSSEFMLRYKKEKSDYEHYIDHFLRGSKALDSLYNRMGDLPSEEKRNRKERMMRQIVENLDTVSFHSAEYYRVFEEELPDNSYFMSILRYNSSQDSLIRVWKDSFSGDLKAYIRYLSDNFGR